MSVLTHHDLSDSATVSRRLVHRAAVCEVFLTGSARTSDTEFVVAAQLPRVHSYYSDHTTAPATYDPLLLVEAFRQASILITHRHLDVPLDRKYIFNDGDLQTTDIDALGIGPLPACAVLNVRITAEKHRGSELVGIGLDMTLAIDGRTAASMAMTIQWMPPEAWEKLRVRGRAALRLDPPRAFTGEYRLVPESVGRTSPRNVLLIDTAVVGQQIVGRIFVDLAHPALFDHPLDHVPAALLFEAYRQTALHAAHELLGLSPHRLLLTRCSAAFTRFGELELPTTCTAELVDDPQRPDEIALRLRILQEEAEISSALVHLRCTSPIGRVIARAPMPRAN